jgi:hypothetical protein
VGAELVLVMTTHSGPVLGWGWTCVMEIAAKAPLVELELASKARRIPMSSWQLRDIFLIFVLYRSNLGSTLIFVIL